MNDCCNNNDTSAQLVLKCSLLGLIGEQKDTFFRVNTLSFYDGLRPPSVMIGQVLVTGRETTENRGVFSKVVGLC